MNNSDPQDPFPEAFLKVLSTLEDALRDEDIKLTVASVPKTQNFGSDWWASYTLMIEGRRYSLHLAPPETVEKWTSPQRH